jgi:hypothetical protein
MTPYETYQLFLAIKSHFNNQKYDFFRYGGKVRADHKSFEKRRDKHQFYKLSKHDDPLGYLVANFVSSRSVRWVGDLFDEENERIYLEWLTRKQTIGYQFKSDLGKLGEGFRDSFKVKDGQHPPLLVAFKRGDISIETLSILNDLLNFFPYWDKKINETVLWPSIRDKCIKYAPFVRYDKQKIKQIVRNLL